MGRVAICLGLVLCIGACSTADSGSAENAASGASDAAPLDTVFGEGSEPGLDFPNNPGPYDKPDGTLSQDVAEDATPDAAEPAVEPTPQPDTATSDAEASDSAVEPDSAREPASEPAAEPTPQPDATGDTSDAETSDAAVEPEPASEPAVEPVSEPAPQPAVEPSPESDADAEDGADAEESDAVVEPAPEPTPEPVPEPTFEPDVAPVEDAPDASPGCDVLCGDGSEDGEVNGDDLLLLAVWVQAGVPVTGCEHEAVDLFKDGALTLADQYILTGILNGQVEGGGCQQCTQACGDPNADGIIDIFDISFIETYILQEFTYSACSFWAADVNQDSVVNVNDIVDIIALLNEDEPLNCAP